MIRARLDKSGYRVLCYKTDCGCELAFIRDGVGNLSWGRRFLFFDLAWRQNWIGTYRVSIWALLGGARSSFYRGRKPKLRRTKRVIERLSEATGLVRFEVGRGVWKFPTGVLCYKCGTRQLLDPEVLKVEPLNEGLAGMVHVVYLDPPEPPGPPGDLFENHPELWEPEAVDLTTEIIGYDSHQIEKWLVNDRIFMSQELNRGIITLLSDEGCAMHLTFRADGNLICNCLACRVLRGVHVPTSLNVEN